MNLSERRQAQNLYKRETTEARFHAAAVEVFTEKGYAGATISDIVVRSGLSRGAFYLHYQSKGEIFKALVHQAIKDCYNIIVPSAQLPLRERIRESTHRHFEQFSRHRGILKCLFEVSTVIPELGALHNEYRAEFVKRIERHLRKMIAEGLCNPELDTQVASYCLACMIGGVTYMWLCAEFEPWQKKQKMDSLVNQVTEFWCKTLYLNV